MSIYLIVVKHQRSSKANIQFFMNLKKLENLIDKNDKPGIVKITIK